MRNALANIRNEDAITTTTTHYKISRTTLYNHFKNAQFCQNVYNDKQRFSIIQKKYLKR